MVSANESLRAWCSQRNDRAVEAIAGNDDPPEAICKVNVSLVGTFSPREKKVEQVANAVYKGHAYWVVADVS